LRFMDYKKVQDQEMYTFDPIVTQQKPPPKPFDDRDDHKDRRNKGKEKRISVSVVILTFLASVCVLFGTLYPELSRGEIDMTPWRDMIQAGVKTQGWLIRDRITLVNLGLWRYCYDDQLYDLIEIVNPQWTNLGKRRRRSVEEEEEHSVEKRQIAREGDISIRCHNVPKPWKMPYHVKNKTEATKICLIIGIVTCILSFLISILVLITRLPILKLIQLISCFLGVASVAVSLGLCISVKDDAEWYFNEAMGRSLNRVLSEEFGLNFDMMSINLKSAELVDMEIGISAIFVIASCFLMLFATILAELSRNLN